MENYARLRRLEEDDQLLTFDCGDEDLNHYFFNDAKSYQKQLLAVTYYVVEESETILFFSLSNDKITSLENTTVFGAK